VEAALEHHDLAAAPVLAGELERALHRLGARVAEEHAPLERGVGQALGKSHRGLGVEEVAHVHEPARLPADGLDHRRVAVPELHHRDPSQEVEVLVALVVPQARALPAHELHGIARVGGHHGLALEGLERL
jgi:hypothetical protein